MQGFLNQTPLLPVMPREQLRLEPPSHGVHLRAQSASPRWTADPAFAAPPSAHFSPEEFAKFQQLSQSASSRSIPAPTGTQTAGSFAQHRPTMGVGMVNMGLHYGMMPSSIYHQPQLYPQAPRQTGDVVDVKGKGKVVELDDRVWEEQFAQIELQDQQARDQDENLAMEPELNEMDRKILESETGFGDLESIWNGMMAENAAMRESGEGTLDFKSGPEEWDSFGDWDGMHSRIGMNPAVEDYLFEEDNPFFRNQPDPFAEGLRIMEESGNLSLAALAFEAACQKDTSHIEAWVHLGAAQAQNEKEEAAIRALEHALTLDPRHLSALMGLAISYTNEGYDTVAYRTLERWLSAKYPGVLPPDQLSSPADMGFTDRMQLHERVKDAFIRAAQLSPDGEHMDPDVQVGLGVLFYGSDDYDKAVDCFQAALASTEQGASNQRSQLHLLWNRLGATLANSGRSEEAIAAYEKALTIHPNFVRARYNLGVSCINVGCHAEAAGHLLAALDMHNAVETRGREQAREILGGVSDENLERMTTQNRSTTLYDTLRRVFGQMGRRDLAEKVVPGVNPEIFRSEFDF